MPVYVITGKLGGGKTLLAMHMMVAYINQGRRIATNIDIYPENFKDTQNKKVSIIRVEDMPNSETLHSLGKGYDGDYKGEEFNGMLLLDECGTWLNSREWNNKDRRHVIDWLLHARKLRWDVYLIIQHVEMLDKQVRKSLCEHTVWLRRMDRYRIPIIGQLTKILGKEVRMPKWHIGIVKYGDTQQHPTVDSWKFNGSHYYKIYDTEQAFTPDYSNGPYSLLTPWHLVGRYEREKLLVDHLNVILMPIIRVLCFYPYVLGRRVLRRLRLAGGATCAN